MASRSGQSAEDMEINEPSASDYEPEESDHGADVGGQSEPEVEPPYVAPGVPSIDCPSEILTKYARGPYDPKSPLKQFATKVTRPTPSGGGTRKWKCNICGAEWFGSITRVNSHLLFWTGYGVNPCIFLSNPENVKYRIEVNKLWGIPDDSDVPVPRSLSARQQVQNIHQLQGQRDTSTRILHQRAGTMSPTPSFSSPTHSSAGDSGRGKRKATTSRSGSNPIAHLFNMHARDRLDDVVGDFFFANGISTHVARSPYFVRMMSMAVNEGEPSYVPPGDHKLKTIVLDRARDKVGILME